MKIFFSGLFLKEKFYSLLHKKKVEKVFFCEIKGVYLRMAAKRKASAMLHKVDFYLNFFMLSLKNIWL